MRVAPANWAPSEPANGLSPASRAVLSLIAFVLIFVAILLATGEFVLLDGDLSWHIMVGKQIWETHEFPRTDQFSHTFAGTPWIAKEWLSQLFLFAAYSAGSWRAVVLLTAVSLAATFTLLFSVLVRELRVTVAFGITLLSILLSLGHFLARPHVFSFPLIVIWTAGLVSAVEAKRRPSLLLLPVMALWANLHAGFTLGLAIAGILALEAIVTAERGARVSTTRTWTGFVLMAVLASCITPYGYDSLLITFKLYGLQPVHYIREWAPLNANDDPVVELVLLALIILALAGGAKIKLFRLLILAVLIHLTFKHVRMAPMFALIAPILIASSLATQFRFVRLDSHAQDDPKFFRFVNQASRPVTYGVLLVGVFAISGLYLHRAPIAPKQHTELKNAVDFLERAQLTERIFHSYNFSGYLMFRGIKVFIDSRIDQLYAGGFFERVVKSIRGLDGGLVPFLEKHDIMVSIVQPNSSEASQLGTSAAWSIIYSDAWAIVFARKRN